MISAQRHLWISVFAVLVCVSLLGGVCHAEQAYTYDQTDKATEQKRYLDKLKQDNIKCDLAIENTKVLIGRSRTRPYLPELYLRLAELYIEKSRVVFFITRSTNPGAGDSIDQFESELLKNQGIEIYQRILSHYPDFKDIDKVRFFMAHEYRELSKPDEMVLQYQHIIKHHPNSRYVPEAYLLLGDYFFNHKQDADMAKRYYERVLSFADSPAVAIARYKLGWCQINMANYPAAIKLFEEAVLSAPAGKEIDIDTYRRVDVRLESMIDMAYCYPESYKKASPEDAVAYFQRYAWSRPVFTTVLEKLASRYYVKKKWAHSAAIYRQLASLRHDPKKLLEYTRNIFECVQALGTYASADKDVALIIRALEKQKYSVHVDRKEKKKNLKNYEVYARDMITHLHAKARKSNSMKDFKLAADAYDAYLGFFDSSPAAREMAANYAEVLFSSGRYMAAGKAYEKLVPTSTVNKSSRKEMLYSAVIAYYNALKNKEALNYFETAFARAGLKTSGHAYAADFPQSAKTRDVLFNVAWIDYDAGRYEQAIESFMAYVNRYPSGKSSEAAVHLIMDAYNTMEDYEGLIAYGNTLMANGSVRSGKLKSEVARIVKGAESKVVSRMTLAASKDWETGKSELRALAQADQKSTIGVQALSALIISSKSKKDLETLFDAGANLVKHHPQSDQVENTLAILIDTAVNIGQFRLLVDFLEQFGTQFSKNKNAPHFLFQAAQIREGLGQYALANVDYQRVLTMNATGGKQREEAILAMAENAVRSGNVQQAVSILSNHKAGLSKPYSVLADAKLAHWYGQLGKRASADRHRRSARKKYKTAYANRIPAMSESMAEMAFDRADLSKDVYMRLQLTGRLDNKIVAKKAKLLESLEKQYQEVMAYQAPAWALQACFGANEAYREFARFLMASPMPKLSPAQQAQYQELLRKKAEAYSDKADQYLDTCVTLARKWVICDPKLAGYLNAAQNPAGVRNGVTCLADRVAARKITESSLGNAELAPLHANLYDSPDSLEVLLALTAAYMRQGDYKQAALVARNALSKVGGGQAPAQAKLYNAIGVSYLYDGADGLAKETFEKALHLDAANVGAKINLAGLYNHYGHDERAVSMIQRIPRSVAVDSSDDIIHPQAGEFYHAHIFGAKK